MDGRQHPHGQGDPAEVARGGICVPGRTLPDRCRGPSRGNYFTGSGQHDVGWSRSDAGREVSEGKADRPENAHGAVRGRLHHHWPLERVAGARGQTRGGRISGGTWAHPIAGQDQGNAHRRRVRLPRMEYPQVQRQAVDEAVESERQSAPRQDPGSHQRQQDGQTSKLDTPAQPASAGLGKLSPPCGRQGNLCSG